VIVSASISNYLKPWCDDMGFHLICSELEVKDGKLTDKFSTLNYNGTEKVRRIKEKYDLSIYDEIHVFGNSKGAFPILELGTHKYYKFFN
jgi:phosphatidylglycerophosphatase C